MEPFKRFLLPAGALIILVASWWLLGRDKTDEQGIFAEAKRGSFQVVITTTGELRAKNSTKILGPRNAREVRIFQLGIQNLVPEGTLVKKGDFVAELDRSEITTRLQDAQLQVQQAESQFEQAILDSSLTLSSARYQLESLELQLEEKQLAVEQSVYESPSVQRQAQIDLDRTRRQLDQEKENYVTRVKQAEARLRELETRLIEEQREYKRISDLIGEFTVYAPDNGMVVYARGFNGSKVTVGSNVSSFDPVIAELPDFSIMESLTYINEVDIQKVRTGQTVQIGLDAIPAKRLTGVVTSVANIGEQRPNSDSKVFEVVIVINESDSVLRPSMTTSNEILVETLEDVVHVPLETVFEHDSMDVVYKQSGLGLVRQQVVLGSFNENDVVVREGVQAGDMLMMSMPTDTSMISFSPLPEEVLERIRQEEEARRAEEERRQAEAQRQAERPAFQMPGNIDFRNLTPAQRDSLRRAFQQGGGRMEFRMGQGGQGGQGGAPGGQRGQGGQGGQGRQGGQGTQGAQGGAPGSQAGQGGQRGQGGQGGQPQQIIIRQ